MANDLRKDDHIYNSEKKHKISLDDYNHDQETHRNNQEKYGKYFEEIKTKPSSALENFINSEKDTKFLKDYTEQAASSGIKIITPDLNDKTELPSNSKITKDQLNEFNNELKETLNDLNKIREKDHLPPMEMPKIMLFEGKPGCQFLPKEENGVLALGDSVILLDKKQRMAVMGHEMGHAYQYTSSGISDKVSYNVLSHIDDLSPNSKLHEHLNTIANDKTIKTAFSNAELSGALGDIKGVDAVLTVLKKHNIETLQGIDEFGVDNIKKEVSAIYQSGNIVAPKEFETEYSKLRPDIELATISRETHENVVTQRSETFANDMLNRLEKETGKPYAQGHIEYLKSEVIPRQEYDYSQAPELPYTAPNRNSGHMPAEYEIARHEYLLTHGDTATKSPPLAQSPTQQQTKIQQPEYKPMTVDDDHLKPKDIDRAFASKANQKIFAELKEKYAAVFDVASKCGASGGQSCTAPRPPPAVGQGKQQEAVKGK